MSVPIRRQAVHISKARTSPAISSSSTSATVKAESKSRLYRIPKSILKPSFYANIHTTKEEGSLRLNSKSFSVNVRQLPDDVIKDINEGPSYLRGFYPPGLLSKSQEKRRMVNYVPFNSWKEGDESEKDHLKWEKNYIEYLKEKIPILEKSNKEIDKIPTLIIASKKKIDKRAVKRNAVVRKLWNAFDQAVQQVEGSVNTVPRDSTRAFTFSVNKEIETVSAEELAKELNRALVLAASVRAKHANVRSAQSKRIPFNRRSSPPRTVSSNSGSFFKPDASRKFGPSKSDSRRTPPLFPTKT